VVIKKWQKIAEGGIAAQKPTSCTIIEFADLA